ncbi:hypothetical protein [Oceanithermus desulfurans]
MNIDFSGGVLGAVAGALMALLLMLLGALPIGLVVYFAVRLALAKERESAGRPGAEQKTAAPRERGDGPR